MITQKELEEYLSLNQAEKAISDRRTRLRDELLAKLREGAKVQRGKLSARVRTSTRGIWSFDNVANILGVSEAQKLKDQLPLATSESLIVE